MTKEHEHGDEACFVRVYAASWHKPIPTAPLVEQHVSMACAIDLHDCCRHEDWCLCPKCKHPAEDGPR